MDAYYALTGPENTPKYEDAQMFMHCAKCLPLIPKGKSADEWMEYVGAATEVKGHDGKPTTVMAMFCKRCKRQVWYTRHLTAIAGPSHLCAV